MTPVIRHLHHHLGLPFPVNQDSKEWVFDSELSSIEAHHYRRLVPLQPVLSMEYSVLCHQIRHNFSDPNDLDEQQIMERLIAALMLCELLEYNALHCLNIPREVLRLRGHKKIFRELLSGLGGYTFARSDALLVPADTHFSQYVREYTSLANSYRLILARGRRLFNALGSLDTGSPTFTHFVSFIDRHTGPLFTHLGWCVFLPRLLVTLFLILKHTVVGFWMSEEERSLGWYLRMKIQIQRRWFELSNDVLWVVLSLLNAFIFIGPLAPVAVFTSLSGLAFDIVCAGVRAYIELNRLYELQNEYSGMLGTDGVEGDKEILEYQKYLAQRIDFEQLRLGLSVVNTSVVLLLNCLALPMLMLNPIMPVIAAALLVILWGINFTLSRIIEAYRPQDALEKPAHLDKLGFFACRSKAISEEPVADFDVDDDTAAEPSPSL